MMELPPVKPLHYHGKRWTPFGLEVHGDLCVFTPLPGQTGLIRLVGWIGYAGLALAALILLKTFDPAMTAFTALIGGLFIWVSRWAGERNTVTPSFDLKHGQADIPEGIVKTTIRRIALNEVEAVQYTPFRKHGTEPFKVIHAELSLLLRGGARLNLVHHNDLARMRADGEKLAGLLGVPLHVHGIWHP